MNKQERIAKNIIALVAIQFEGHNFEMNRELVEQYLIKEGIGVNDYDGGFESALEGLVPEHVMSDHKRECKASSILEEYVVGFWDFKDVA